MSSKKPATQGNSTGRSASYFSAPLIFAIALMLFLLVKNNALFSAIYVYCKVWPKTHPWMIPYNIAVIYFALVTVSAMIIRPIFRVFIPNHIDWGAKLGWNEDDFKALSAQKRTSHKIIRTLIIIALAAFLLPLHNVLPFPVNLLIPHFYPGYPPGQVMIPFDNIYRYIYPLADFLVYGINFLAILYPLIWLEVRSRILIRLIEFNDKRLTSLRFLLPLPPRPFDPNSPSFNLAISTKLKIPSNKDEFPNEQEEEKINVIVPKNKTGMVRETWLNQEYKQLCTSILFFAPPGVGKTSAIIYPTLDDAINWQANNDALKISILINDPKKDLGPQVIKKAKEAGRESDLRIIGYGEDSHQVNVLKIDDEHVWSNSANTSISDAVFSAYSIFNDGRRGNEPYWENNARSLLSEAATILFLEEGGNITIADIADFISEADSCFTLEKIEVAPGSFKEEETLTSFGKRVLIAKLSLESDIFKMYLEISKYSLGKIKKRTIDPATSASVARTRAILLAEIKRNKDLILDPARTAPTAKIEDSAIYRDIAEMPTEMMATIADILEQANKFRIMHLKRGGSIQMANIAINNAYKYFFGSWTSNPNKSNITSTISPFLSLFKQSEIRRCLSSKNETISFREITKNGTILVPFFDSPTSSVKAESAYIALIKSRYQRGLLQTKCPHRLTLIVEEEWQRTISFGNGMEGDIDTIELQRSFGVCTIAVTQSVSALQSRAPSKDSFEKIWSVFGTIHFAGTLDDQTIKKLEYLCGSYETVNRSISMNETASSTQRDGITDKFSGANDSLGVSYTESMCEKKAITISQIVKMPDFTLLSFVKTGEQRSITLTGLKPHYWPRSRDRWEFARYCEGDPTKPLPLKFWLFKWLMDKDFRKNTTHPVRELVWVNKILSAVFSKNTIPSETLK